MQTRSALPLTAVVLVHGEFFLCDITSRALAVDHGLEKGRTI
jgi:hypothetical protein